MQRGISFLDVLVGCTIVGVVDLTVLAALRAFPAPWPFLVASFLLALVLVVALFTGICWLISSLLGRITRFYRFRHMKV